jgi:hypothetical protein
VNCWAARISATNHNTGVIMAAMCSNRHICRGSCNRAELRRERSCGPNTPTRSFTDGDERRQLVDRTINLWAAGRACPQENCHGAGSAPPTSD